MNKPLVKVIQLLKEYKGKVSEEIEIGKNTYFKAHNEDADSLHYHSVNYDNQSSHFFVYIDYSSSAYDYMKYRHEVDEVKKLIRNLVEQVDSLIDEL